MRTIIILIIISLNLLVFSQTDITIIHVNDTHSQLDAVGQKDAELNGTIGGIAKAASVISYLQQTETNPIFLHGGDLFVGTLFFNNFFGVPELQILKELNCDAMTLGNHEFDLGSEPLGDALDAAFVQGGFPLLAANADVSGCPQLQPYIQPYTIKTFSGVKVGIFGLTIPDPLNNPDPVLISDSLAEIASLTVAELQAQNVNVIVLLSHLGNAIDAQIAQFVPGIHVIIGAHDHNELSQPITVHNPAGFDTYICQAGRSYKNVGKLNLTYNNGMVTVTGYQLIPVDVNTPAVHSIEAIISSLKDDISSIYGDVFTDSIGFVNNDVEQITVGNPKFKDIPMGNLITDAYRFVTNTEIGISANGLVSDKLYKGVIVPADLFRTVAYGFDIENGLDFRLIKFTMKGLELVTGIEYSLSYLGISEDFFLQVSGVRFKYNASAPVGQRVLLHSLRINDQIIDPTRNYSITVNEALFGILTDMGLELTNVEPTTINEFTALCYYVAANKIKTRSEGRIKEYDALENDNLSENEITDKIIMLYGNYPNPFNPVTTIRYMVPAETKVALKVYNALGQEIKTLVNEVQKQGIYMVHFDASNLPSGIYFYRLITDSYSATKKMILVR